MKIVKIILGIVVALVAIFLIIGLVVPTKMQVQRSIVINASGSVVLDQIKYFKNFIQWDPWSELDPNCKYTYEGTDGEIGSSYTWEGNDEVGKGSQQLAAITDSSIETKLVISEPWESEAAGFFKWKGEGDGINLTWGFKNETPFPMNAMSIFMDMDAMLGKDFEKGLNTLKSRCEEIYTAMMTNKINGYEINEIDFQSKTYFAKKGEVSIYDIGNFYKENFPKILGLAMKSGMQIAGAPSGIFYSWKEAEMKTEMAAAIPVVAKEDSKIKNFERIDIEGGKALQIGYYGAHDKSEKAHLAMDEYMKVRNMGQRLVIEEYITDPGTEPDTAKWLTNITYLLE